MDIRSLRSHCSRLGPSRRSRRSSIDSIKSTALPRSPRSLIRRPMMVRFTARVLGRAGAESPDGVYRIGLPRTDLKVVLDGVELKPALALGSWLAFRLHGDQALVMGDLVLTADEVSPVMRKLAAEGIEITALHNHLLRAAPATLYMHILGRGDPVRLAAALHDGLTLSKT